jgi:hypothetical protein
MRQQFRPVVNTIHVHLEQHVWIPPMVHSVCAVKATKEMEDFLREQTNIKRDQSGRLLMILAAVLVAPVMFQLVTKCHLDQVQVHTLDQVHQDQLHRVRRIQSLAHQGLLTQAQAHRDQVRPAQPILDRARLDHLDLHPVILGQELAAQMLTNALFAVPVTEGVHVAIQLQFAVTQLVVTHAASIRPLVILTSA